MKVANGTAYDTRELKKIFHQVVRDLLKKRPSWAADWKEHGGDYRVKISNRLRDDFTSGHAQIGLEPVWWTHTHKRAQNMHLSIPKNVSVAKLAATFEHELYHAFGVDNHSDLPPSVNDCNPDPFAHYPELLGLPERLSYVVKVQKPKPTKEETQRKRVETLLERRKGWVTKARRAETALSKIDASLKRYRRQGHQVGDLPKAAKTKRAKRNAGRSR